MTRFLEELDSIEDPAEYLRRATAYVASIPAEDLPMHTRISRNTRARAPTTPTGRTLTSRQIPVPISPFARSSVHAEPSRPRPPTQAQAQAPPSRSARGAAQLDGADERDEDPRINAFGVPIPEPHDIRPLSDQEIATLSTTIGLALIEHEPRITSEQFLYYAGTIGQLLQGHWDGVIPEEFRSRAQASSVNGVNGVDVNGGPTVIEEVHGVNGESSARLSNNPTINEASMPPVIQRFLRRRTTQVAPHNHQPILNGTDSASATALLDNVATSNGSLGESSDTMLVNGTSDEESALIDGSEATWTDMAEMLMEANRSQVERRAAPGSEGTERRGVS